MYLSFTSPAGLISSVTATSTENQHAGAEHSYARDGDMFRADFNYLAALALQLPSTDLTGGQKYSADSGRLELELSGRDKVTNSSKFRGGETHTQAWLSRLGPGKIRFEPRLHQTR